MQLTLGQEKFIKPKIRHYHISIESNAVKGKFGFRKLGPATADYAILGLSAFLLSNP